MCDRMKIDSLCINRRLLLVLDGDWARATYRCLRIFIEVNDIIDSEAAFEYNVWSIGQIQLRSYLFITPRKRKKSIIKRHSV